MIYDDDYEEYEKECERQRERNNTLMELFEKDLTAKGLSEKTIQKHLTNVGVFLDTYLLYEDIHPMEDGPHMLDGYLGYFYIRKCMWSTPGNIKTTAASIKKFYKSMVDHGKLDAADYKDMCAEIKDCMDQWQADCAQYNDPYADNPFDWF